MKMTRKNLWIPDLLSSIKNKVIKKITVDNPHGNTKFNPTDYILNEIALFHLKQSSLLQFDRDDPTILANIKSLYQINKVPSDTHFRVGLDKVEPSKIKY